MGDVKPTIDEVIADERIMSAARSWAPNRHVDIDLGDPHIDKAFERMLTKVVDIVGVGNGPTFLTDLRHQAANVRTIQPGSAGARHRVDYDLILIPAVGPVREVHALAADVDRMRTISEIARTCGLLTRSEEVFLLPVVLDATALTFPKLASIRSAVTAMAERLDSPDPYEDGGMEKLASDVAGLLGGTLAGEGVPDKASVSPAIHAFVGVTTSRLGSSEKAVPILPLDEQAAIRDMLAAMAEVTGNKVKVGGPGDWGSTATAASLELVTLWLDTLRVLWRIPADARIMEIRRTDLGTGSDMGLSFEFEDRVVGPIVVPRPLAFQVRKNFEAYLDDLGPVDTCEPEDLMRTYRRPKSLPPAAALPFSLRHRLMSATRIEGGAATDTKLELPSGWSVD